MFRAQLANPAMWDGHVEHLSIIKLYKSVDSAKAKEPSTAMGGLVLTSVLHYIVEFLDPKNPVLGFKMVSEDVLESVSDVVVHQNFSDGDEPSWLFELSTFTSKFVFAPTECERTPLETAKALAQTLNSLPCVTMKWQYLDAIPKQARDVSSSMPRRSYADPGENSRSLPPSAAGAQGRLFTPSPSPAVPQGSAFSQRQGVQPIPMPQLSNIEAQTPGANQRPTSSIPDNMLLFQLEESEKRAALREEEVSGRLQLLGDCAQGTALILQAQFNAGKYLEEVKAIHTTIDTFDLFDPVVAEGANSSSNPGSSSTGAGGGNVKQSIEAKLRGRGLSFFSKDTDKDSVFESWLDEEAKQIAEEFEKVARQKCGKYFTSQQRQLVDKRRATERDILSKKLREATKRFDAERGDLHHQLDQAVTEMRRLQSVNQHLQAELQVTQQREKAVLERSRKREAELSNLLSSSARQRSASMSLQPDEHTPVASPIASSAGLAAASRKQSFNFFASTPKTVTTG